MPALSDEYGIFPLKFNQDQQRPLGVGAAFQPRSAPVLQVRIAAGKPLPHTIKSQSVSRNRLVVQAE
jgi:hypothetical protein